MDFVLLYGNCNFKLYDSRLSTPYVTIEVLVSYVYDGTKVDLLMTCYLPFMIKMI